MGKNLITTPFSDEVVRIELGPGLTIVDILQKAKVPFLVWDQVVVALNGIELQRDQWDVLLLREEDSVALFVTQHGDETGKTILRLVAVIAIAVAAFYTGGYVGILMESAAWGTAASAAVTLVGTMLLTALIPPPSMQDGSGSAKGNSYFLSGQENRARFYETIPIVYGSHKMVANLASTVDVFNRGVSSIFSAVYDFGLGGAVLSQLKAGDTDLELMNGRIRILKRIPELIDPQQPQLGMNPVDLKLVTFPINYQEISLGLDDTDDEQISTTALGCSAAVVELAFPQGLVHVDKKGKQNYATVDFELSFKPASGAAYRNPPLGTRAYAGEHLRASMGVARRGDGDYGDLKGPGSVADAVVVISRPMSVDDAVPTTVNVKFKNESYPVVTGSSAFKIYDPDTGDLFTGGSITGDTITTVTPGQEYEFGITFNASFKGRFEVRMDAEDFRPSSVVDTPPFDSSALQSDVGHVDMTISTPPIVGDPYEPPAIPPSGPPRYDVTAGNETYIEVVEYRPAPFTGLWLGSGSGVTLMIEGVSHSVSIPDMFTYRGELISTGIETWTEGSFQYRMSRYALKYIPTFIDDAGLDPGDDVYVEPDAEPGPVEAGIGHRTFTISGNRAQFGIVSIIIPFPAANQYDIRIVRRTPIPTKPTTINGCTWIKLNSRASKIADDDRSVLNLKKQHTLMELVFEANENISGNVQQVSAMARGEVRTYTTAWQPPKITSNPAWIVLDILTGHSIQNHQDVPSDHLFDGGWIKDDQIDFPAFVSFAALCDESVSYTDAQGNNLTRPRYACDILLATDSPIIETAQNMLSMARAQLIMNQQGKYSVLRDEAQSTPRQMFTPQNSWGFSGSRTFQEIPHAFFVEFSAPELGYQTGTTIVYRPGYDVDNTKIFETLQTYGVTNWHQASQYGMYMLAQGFLRNEIFTLSCDLENLVIQRGDMVHIQHDVPLLGGTACIVKQDSATDRVYVDQELGSYDVPWGFSLRRMDGTIVTGDLVFIGPDYVDMSSVLDTEQGEVFVIGTKKATGMVTDPYLVMGIIPKANLQAEITLVKYDETLYETDWGSFPTWDPSFGQSPSEETDLYTDNLVGFASFEVVDRSPISTTYLTWDIEPSAHADSCKYIRVAYRLHTSGEIQELAQIDGGSREYTFEYPADDIRYGRGFYTIQPISNLGYLGKAQTISVGQAVDNGIPDAATGLIAEYVAATSTTTLRWDLNSEIDIEAYMIYTSLTDLSVGGTVEPDLETDASYITSTEWNASQMLVLTGVPMYYYIVVADTSGNYSPATTELSVPISGSNGLSIHVGNVFLRKASVPNTPLEDDGRYDFDTLVLTPPDIAGGSDDDWEITPPTGTDPLYVSSGTFSILGITGEDDTVIWSDPDLLVSDGLPGDSIAVVNAYLRKPTAPVEPVDDTLDEYSFTTKLLTPPSIAGGSSDNWSDTIPNGTDPLYVISATASVPGTTGIDATLDWTSPDLLTHDGAGYVPDFSPGFIGGQSDFVYTLNAIIGGTPNDGEIRVQGTTFIHPDGTEILSLVPDFSIYTHYESPAIGRFFLMYSSVAAETRFGGASIDWGVGDTRFISVIYDDVNGWQAKNNDGLDYPFTPLSTDCIIARCDKTIPSGGINSIQVITGGLAGAEGTAGQATRYVTIFRKDSNTIDTNAGFYSDPLDGNSSWSYSVPALTADGEVVYSASRVFTSDAAPPQQSTWSTPTLAFVRNDGETGAVGQGVRHATLYRKNNSARTSTTTGTYADPIGTNTNWSFNLPAITDNADVIYSMTRIFTSDASAPQEANWSAVTLVMQRVDGSSGLDARAVNLTMADQSFEYTPAGTTPDPVNALVTATALNTTGTVYYQFYVNDSSVQNTTSNTFTYTPQALFTNMPDKIEVHIREGASTGTIMARDQITASGLKAGVDGIAGVNAINVILSNEAHTLPTTNVGVVTYTGSGTNIEAWEGTVRMPYDGGSPYASPSFRVSVSSSPNIAPDSTPTTPSTYVRQYQNASAMNANTASIVYSVIVKNAAGVETTFTKTQTFAKSWEGDDGVPGNDGDDGVDGSDGESPFYIELQMGYGDADTLSWTKGGDGVWDPLSNKTWLTGKLYQDGAYISQYRQISITRNDTTGYLTFANGGGTANVTASANVANNTSKNMTITWVYNPGSGLVASMAQTVTTVIAGGSTQPVDLAGGMAFNSSSGTAYAGWYLYAAGEEKRRNGATYSTINTWLNPGSTATDYEVYVTHSGQAITGSGIDSWIGLGSGTKYWLLSGTIFKDAMISIKIRHKTTLVVYDTCNVSLSIEDGS